MVKKTGTPWPLFVSSPQAFTDHLVEYEVSSEIALYKFSMPITIHSTNITQSIVGFLLAPVRHAIVTCRRRRSRCHAMSHSTFKRVVKHLAADTVPQRRTHALEPADPVDAGSAVLTRQ